MGAIASGGVRVVNDEVVRVLGVPDAIIEQVAAEEQVELERRERAYRGDVPAADAHGKTVILIDDGLATGTTMRAAVKALRTQQPARIVIAVPVGAAQTCAELEVAADELICLRMPEPFQAVGIWYENFEQTTDAEVRAQLQRAAEEAALLDRIYTVGL
jgi:putative phosphoribosyl transferase